MLKKFLRTIWSKITLHCLLLLPFLEECYQVFALLQNNEHRLGPDPGKVILEDFASIAIWLLLLSLSLTPIKKVFRFSEVMRFSRLIGLYVFFYVCLHILSYLAFILAWDFSTFTEDIIKRPYMIVGATSALILFSMALTSYKFAIRKLGNKWKKLHKFVYIAAILALTHEWWQAKQAIGEPLLHATILFILLSTRFYYSKKKSFP